MYNANRPSVEELPSSKQLLGSTLGAALVAALLLITTILPAEYGIDPTGIGRALGLAQMGEIKASLAAEAAADSEPAVTEVPAAVASTAPVETPVSAVVTAEPAVAIITSDSDSDSDSESAQSAVAQDQRTLVLVPGAAAELKLTMREGAKVRFNWSVDQGHLNYDTHGDNPSTNYHGYAKGRKVKGGQGELVAAFDGAHGWFWRNRSEVTVTLTLNTEGDYQGIKRVL